MFDIFSRKKKETAPVPGTVDFIAYQKAKRLVPKLEASIISIYECYKILLPHKDILPLETALLALYDAEIVINSHLIKNKKILESKGLVDGIKTRG